MNRGLVIGLWVALCFTGTAGAQEHELFISSGSGGVGSQVTISNTYNNNSIDVDIQGYGWGNCIADPSIADTNMVVEGANSAGATTGASFFAPSIFPGQGWTLGGVTDFLGMTIIPPGVGYELALASYDILAEGVTAVDYCDTLGTPAVPTGVADAAAASFIPVTSGGTITGSALPPGFVYTAGDASVGYDPAVGTASVTVAVSIAENPANPGTGDTTGFSMGLDNDPNLLTVTTISEAPLTGALGAGAAFVGPAIQSTSGWTIGIVYDFLGMAPLAFATETTVLDITYDTVPATLIGDLDGEVTSLTWSDALGDPPVVNVVTVGVAAQTPVFVDGTITLNAVVDVPFIRGDCNQDLTLDISDPVNLLQGIFAGGTIGCGDACDADDDATLGLTDALTMLMFMFQGGGSLPAPFPSCGIDGAADALDCQTPICP